MIYKVQIFVFHDLDVLNDDNLLLETIRRPQVLVRKTRKNLSLNAIKRDLDLTNVWWETIKTNTLPDVDRLEQMITHESTRSVEKNKILNTKHYITPIKKFYNSKANVNAQINTYLMKNPETNHFFVLTVINFISRSFKLNLTFRYLFTPHSKIILQHYPKLNEKPRVNEKILKIFSDVSTELITNEIVPRFYQSERTKANNGKNLLSPLPLRGLIFRDLRTKKTYPLTKLKIVSNLEVSGVKGLGAVTLEGNDILRAEKIIEQMTETGSWALVETQDFIIDLENGIMLKKWNFQLLEYLFSQLNKMEEWMQFYS